MSSQQKPSKELKIVTRPVVTLDSIRANDRLKRLICILNAYGEITERGLQHLIYELQKSGYDLGYQFLTIKNMVSSKSLREDLVELLYVGVLESDPRNKKFKLTSQGQEFLNEILPSIPGEEVEKIKGLVEEVRAKITTIDAEAELSSILRRSSRRRRS